MAGYDPQRNRARSRNAGSEEPAAVDALLGPPPDGADQEPTPAPIAVNDAGTAVPEPVTELRPVPDPETAASPGPVAVAEEITEPDPAADPEPLRSPEPDSVEESSRPDAPPRPSTPVAPSSKRKVVAAVLALLALLAVLVAWARRRS